MPTILMESRSRNEFSKSSSTLLAKCRVGSRAAALAEGGADTPTVNSVPSAPVVAYELVLYGKVARHFIYTKLSFYYRTPNMVRMTLPPFIIRIACLANDDKRLVTRSRLLLQVVCVMIHETSISMFSRSVVVK